MDIRYQVFVSSTFADLQEERRGVIQTLMEVSCIPAGMELFPAQDETQLEFIKKVIDDCDYYLLIIGGRYGSTTAEGISYTEQEYDYAVGRGLKVVALLHGAPEDLPLKKSEADATGREKLAVFRKRVSEGRLVKFWRDASDLQAKVAISMLSTIRAYPAVGWTRANRAASEELLSEINNLRKQKEQLEVALANAQPDGGPIPHLARFDEQFKLTLRYNSGGQIYFNTSMQTWERLFGLVGPSILDWINESTISANLAVALLDKHLLDLEVIPRDLETLRVQFQALGLIQVKYLPAVGKAFWKTTPLGARRTIEIRAVRTGASNT